MNCLYCNGKFCNCGGTKCNCSSSTRNGSIVMALTALGVQRGVMALGSQNDLVINVLNFVKEKFPSPMSIDVSIILDEFGPETIPLVDVRTSMKMDLGCKYHVFVQSAKCINCNRPKWHRDQFGGDCKVLVNRYS